MEVSVTNLKRYFGKTKAVDGISFEFTSGHIFGFVGPNGAGKTTTMRILATLDEPTEGNAYISGVSVVEEPEKARHLLGFMPDSLPTHRDMTVKEYLDFFGRAYGLHGRKRTRYIESIVDFTNLTGLQGKFLRALSKGMKQRVSLARALVHDPPVLVMDEPAAGLDPRARVELRELLKALADQGKAILISSHILTDLAEQSRKPPHWTFPFVTVMKTSSRPARRWWNSISLNPLCMMLAIRSPQVSSSPAICTSI